MRIKYIFLSFILLLFVWRLPAYAQWESHESVLNTHTWFKIGVTEDGVYGIDVPQLRSLGVDPASLNPSQIRLFGNVQGMLPEANAEARFDDLTEIAVQVTGSEDGSLDGSDQILFYGHGPVNMTLNPLSFYNYEPNYYTDTVYYFLCVDSGVNGLRIQDQSSVPTSDIDPQITDFQDYVYHDKDEISPYASGRIWYGDLITAQEGAASFTYEIPNRVTSKPIHIKSTVLGRCSSPFSYNLKLNGRMVLDQAPIASFGQYEYGKENVTEQNVSSDTESITVRYEINAGQANPMLFIEHFMVSFWRELRFQQKELAFRIAPFQMLSRIARIQLSGVDASVHCWDVTDPLNPSRQLLEFAEDGAFFGMDGSTEHRFHLFEMSGVKQVGSIQFLPNQNIHGVADAELLIITPKVFQGPAEALAEFHRTRDGMTCVLADIDEIYNEFGTGTHDPTAMRDFIRMVYLRSDGHLKYVLLMGKGSHDYRDIKGLGNNFVPTFETKNKSCLEVESICTDDYFGLMDLWEGKDCEGRVDLGIGRLPITTEEQGYALVEKIKHYADLSATHGIWKNTHLFMADNDSRLYVTYAEYLDQIMDTACYSSTTKKIYLDSYPLENTPSGMRCPGAHNELMRSFDEGFAVMSYTGHGGVKSLTAEGVLSISDALSLNNFDRLPFIHTATCEFSKYDNPNVVSAGELLMLNAHGGAIAMLTTVRPTYPQNNQKLSRSFHEHVYNQDDTGMLRFGDIYQRVKSDESYYDEDNLVYVLFADPALRFSYPTEQVSTSKINGMSPLDNVVCHSSELMTVEGYISGQGGKIDNSFNGVLEARLYSGKTEFTTLGSNDQAQNYSFFHEVLFEGAVSVTSGHFTLQIPVPSDIGQGKGFARLSYYAYDSVRQIEANGTFNRLEIVDGGSTGVVDNQGPDIHLYWNTPDFENGDVVTKRGTLFADVYDANGIYHYNVSIGRDLLLNSNVREYNNIVVNDYFEPALDDYQRGRIVLPVRELDEGTYEFSLRVWDTRDNVSEATIVFVVEQQNLLAQVINYPNPFTEETWFSFVHGDISDRLKLDIEIFDILGRHVATLHTETVSENGVVTPVRWDGRNENGSALVPGVYVYRMIITDSKGKSRTVTQRMVKK